MESSGRSLSSRAEIFFHLSSRGKVGGILMRERRLAASIAGILTLVLAVAMYAASARTKRLHTPSSGQAKPEPGREPRHESADAHPDSGQSRSPQRAESVQRRRAECHARAGCRVRLAGVHRAELARRTAERTARQRDTPSSTYRFGDPTYSGPTVWQTFRGKVEIFPGAGDVRLRPDIRARRATRRLATTRSRNTITESRSLRHGSQPGESDPRHGSTSTRPTRSLSTTCMPASSGRAVRRGTVRRN